MKALGDSYEASGISLALTDCTIQSNGIISLQFAVVNQGEKDVFDFFFKYIIQKLEGVVDGLPRTGTDILIGTGDIIIGIDKAQEIENLLERSC